MNVNFEVVKANLVELNNAMKMLETAFSKEPTIGQIQIIMNAIDTYRLLSISITPDFLKDITTFLNQEELTEIIKLVDIHCKLLDNIKIYKNDISCYVLDSVSMIFKYPSNYNLGIRFIAKMNDLLIFKDIQYNFIEKNIDTVCELIPNIGYKAIIKHAIHALQIVSNKINREESKKEYEKDNELQQLLDNSGLSIKVN